MTSETFSVACIGGGPGGLFAAITLATRLPGAHVDVFERNRADDVFGFGVVFSDATLDNIDAVDPVLRDTLAGHGTHWDRIDVRAHGQSHSAGGNGMSAVHRRVLLDALRARATELGAHIHYDTAVDVDALARSGGYDLIVAADGANSATRERFVDSLDHSVEAASVKFIWFGTTFRFDGLTFLHRQSAHGNFAVHAYPIGSGLSTFIVETDEQTWRAAGLDEFDTSSPPGVSDEKTQRYLTDLFAADIDGHPLVANNSRWANFRTRRTRRWHARAASNIPVVLIGDAVHTAHFSVGSGTKMAMEDAAALADSVAAHPDDLDAAIADFESIRRPRVARIQDSSVPSLSWWDHFGEYYPVAVAVAVQLPLLQPRHLGGEDPAPRSGIRRRRRVRLAGGTRQRPTRHASAVGGRPAPTPPARDDGRRRRSAGAQRRNRRTHRDGGPVVGTRPGGRRACGRRDHPGRRGSTSTRRDRRDHTGGRRGARRHAVDPGAVVGVHAVAAPHPDGHRRFRRVDPCTARGRRT